MPLPTASDSNIVYGGAGVFFLEERLSTGAALGTPDTSNKIAKIGDVEIDRTPDASTSKEVIAKTNSSEEIKATRAYSPSSSTTTAAKIKLTFAMLESSADHQDFYSYAKGKYFVLLVPQGKHGSKTVDGFFFGHFEDGGKINLSADKETQVPLVFQVDTNSTAITCVVPTDDTVKATAATIAQYVGYKLVATT